MKAEDQLAAWEQGKPGVVVLFKSKSPGYQQVNPSGEGGGMVLNLRLPSYRQGKTIGQMAAEKGYKVGVADLTKMSDPQAPISKQEAGVLALHGFKVNPGMRRSQVLALVPEDSPGVRQGIITFMGWGRKK
jgi:hypothetical protein